MSKSINFSANPKLKKPDSGPPSNEEAVRNIQNYLNHDGGRGFATSKATTFQGKPGYFFISRIEVKGKMRYVIMFSLVNGDSDILVSDLKNLRSNVLNVNGTINWNSYS
ncbi:MAG: hypothetical protein HYX42_08140 [Polaromonas sp.]|uniref:hypothetical protein n=1 Tax=Polaromonas sp. TaxID=1869339 RepID=UPI0025CF98BA|nr:hypothetical protein [Polaromonas sp.]MBI2726204.1 hypothetical protein [Polaromonas sp.]